MRAVVTVTTKAMRMKDGPKFIVSLEVTLQIKEHVLGKQIIVGQLTELN